VDEWARRGIADAVVAPGSRSAPLALALARDPRVRVHVQLDERSAAFFALGLGRATGRPAIVLCTSGTAAANFHPAVLEAHHGRVPLLVCTADRPPELQDVGAAQTIDQTALFGPATRWATTVDPPADEPDAATMWRRLAARAVREATGWLAGPVHLNLRFREPLVPTGAPLIEVPPLREPPVDDPAVDDPPIDDPRSGAPPRSRGGIAPDANTVSRIADLVRQHPRGALVVGWGSDVRAETVERYAAVTGWPVLADAISSARRGTAAISTYDFLARTPEVRDALDPTMVLRLGAPLTSKATTAWMESPGAGRPLVVVDRDPRRHDPERAATELVTDHADRFVVALTHQLHSAGMTPDRISPDRWDLVERSVRRAIDEHIDRGDEPFEGRIARDVMNVVPTGGQLVVASSMPVRDLDSFARPRDDIRVHANRGVNGIDGFVSTTLGIAAGAGAPTVAMLGDLCFLHDSNGLLGAAKQDVDAVFVVVDNNGGGIFSFLPQAELTEHFEELFGTPPNIDLAALAAVHQIPVTRITRADELPAAVEAAVVAGGVRMVHVRTDRETNVARHRELEAVAAAAAKAALGRVGTE